MPRIVVPVVDVARTGTGVGLSGSETTGDVANNHVFTNDGRTVLAVRNVDGSVSRNVTLVISFTGDGQAVTNPTVAVVAGGGMKLIGPFPPNLYNQGSGADAG